MPPRRGAFFFKGKPPTSNLKREKLLYHIVLIIAHLPTQQQSPSYHHLTPWPR